MSAAYTATGGIVTRLGSYQTGTGISNGSNTHNIAIGGDFALYSGAIETTSDGSSDWEYADLQNLQLKLLKVGNTQSRTMVQVSYLYALVTYTPSGYGNNVMGVDRDDIGTINGIASTAVSKVNGV